MKTEEIYLFDALKMMIRLTEIGVPFSMEYKSYSKTRHETNGFRYVERALLRPGLRSDQSDLAETLIAFTEYPSGLPKFFHLSLLVSFNDKKITRKK